jgi:hypothetical protein
VNLADGSRNLPKANFHFTAAKTILVSRDSVGPMSLDESGEDGGFFRVAIVMDISYQKLRVQITL